MSPPETAFQPDSFPESPFYLDAFNALTTERDHGMGYGPIPWTSTVQYARLYGIVDTDGIERFSRMIRLMDTEYLAWVTEKQKEPPKT